MLIWWIQQLSSFALPGLPHVVLQNVLASSTLQNNTFVNNAIEYGTFGEGSQISTNQKRENSAFSPLIGRNL